MGKHTYSNKDITVNWDSGTCIHSAVCVKNLSSVFDTEKKPWVNVDGATPEAVKDLIHKCPSGALTYEIASEQKKDNENMENGSDKLKVTISKDGPYLLKGNFEVEDADGNKVETKEMVALCRCGASSNKPFCDGTHKKVEFKG